MYPLPKKKRHSSFFDPLLPPIFDRVRCPPAGVPALFPLQALALHVEVLGRAPSLSSKKRQGELFVEYSTAVTALLPRVTTLTASGLLGKILPVRGILHRLAHPPLGVPRRRHELVLLGARL